MNSKICNVPDRKANSFSSNNTSSSTAAPSFASTDCVFSSFKQVTHDDVAAAVRALSLIHI